MESASSVDIVLGSKTHTLRVLNLLQQRAIGSALFKAPAMDLKNPDSFDFDGEFDSAVRIVFAALTREDPTGPVDKWLPQIDASYEQLQGAKVAILKFAGYIKDRPIAAAGTTSEQPGPAPGE